MTVLQQDQQLEKMLYSDLCPSVLNFAAGLIREYLAADPPLTIQVQCSYSLEVLNQLAQQGKIDNESVFVRNSIHKIMLTFSGG